jgi:hypothetical protein
VTSDTDAAPETGEEWAWTLGIAHSYISFWTFEMSDYSPEVELTLNDDVIGYFARWKWFSPAAYLPNDGLFWIKLIAEDADGNRSEVIRTVRVDTTDTDGDGKPDAVDNCPDNGNTQQLDADGDDIGDVCDTNTIYGTVSGDIQEGVNIDISVYTCGVGELIAAITTNAEGYYAFGGLENGKYGIYPQHSNYIFSRPAIVLQIPQTEIQPYDFTAITICNLLSDCEAIFNDQINNCENEYSICSAKATAWSECMSNLCQGGTACNGDPVYVCGFPPIPSCNSENESCLETATNEMDQCISNLCQ